MNTQAEPAPSQPVEKQQSAEPQPANNSQSSESPVSPPRLTDVSAKPDDHCFILSCN